MSLRFLILISVFFFTLISLTNGQPTQDPNLDRNEEISYQKFNKACDRDLVIEEYENVYLATAISTMELGWTGNVDQCIEGEISELAMTRTKDRINYFRKLVGISNGIIFIEEKNQKCQKAVLMMDAENMLDHYPTSEWKCSSEDGIQAAGKSNLSYGGHSSASVPQYIRDAGQYNGPVGHRRWILYPKAYEFGFGSTNWGTAMWVIGGNQNPEIYPEFVAYPSPGYFPKPLVYPRWSFSKKGANFNNAKVSIKDEDGKPIELVVEEIVNGYGDNTIVWVPDVNLYDNEVGSDHYFEVSIDSITVGGEHMSYKYEVMAIDMIKQEPLITHTSPSCNDDSGSISLEIATGFQRIDWSNGEVNVATIENLSAGSYGFTITDKLGCTTSYNIDLFSESEPKTLEGIIGNTTATSGSIEDFSVDLIDNGSYDWTVTGGIFVSDSTMHEVSISWGNETSVGKICVVFSENEGCESNEVCMDVELAVSSTTDISLDELTISPNPTYSVLLIESKEKQFDHVIVTDLSGRLMLSKDFVKTSRQVLELNDFAPGVYFVKVKTESGFAVSKFVKK